MDTERRGAYKRAALIRSTTLIRGNANLSKNLCKLLTEKEGRKSQRLFHQKFDRHYFFCFDYCDLI